MVSVKSTLIAVVATVFVSGYSAPSQAAMHPEVEEALIKICKAAKKNQMHHFHKTKRKYNLTSKKIASKVYCNGQPIVEFAQTHGATKTVAHLNKRLGDEKVTAIAATSRLNVNFKD